MPEIGAFGLMSGGMETRHWPSAPSCRAHPLLYLSVSSEPQDSTDERGGDSPACAREEAYAKPDSDLVEVDGGRHVRFSLWGRRGWCLHRAVASPVVAHAPQ
jgi:hypothetical protein